MNIVFTPYGWEERIREGQFSGLLLRPMHPLHCDLGYFAGWKIVVIVLWLPIAYVLSLLFHPTAHITPLGVIVFFIAIWGAYLIRSLNQWTLGMVDVLDDPGRAAVRALLHGRAAAVGPARAARAHARVGAAAGVDPAVPVDVRVPDRGPGRRPAARGAARRPRDAGPVDRDRRLAARDGRSRSPIGATRRWAADARPCGCLWTYAARSARSTSSSTAPTS